MNMQTIGQRIKARREYLGLSHDAIADKLSLTRSTYTRKENGKVAITAEELAIIAKALRVRPSYLYGEDDDDDLSLLEGQMIRGFRNLRDMDRRRLLKQVEMWERDLAEDDQDTIGKKAE